MSKLSSLPRVSREDLPGAPEWVDQLLQVSNEFQEQATQRINQNLLTGLFEDYKFVHGVEQVIKNPFGQTLPVGISNVRCQGLEVDSTGKTTGKLYDLEVESMKWRPVQTRPGQPQRVGVTVKFAPPSGFADVRRSATQAIASGVATAFQYDTNETGIAASGTTITSGAFSFDVTTTTGTPPTNSRINCAAAGFVTVNATLPFDTTGVAALRFAWIAKNNAPNVRWGESGGSLTNYQLCSMHGVIPVVAGDYLQVFCQQGTGGSVNTIGSSLNDYPRFQARYVAPPLTATGRVTLRFDGAN